MRHLALLLVIVPLGGCLLTELEARDRLEYGRAPAADQAPAQGAAQPSSTAPVSARRPPGFGLSIGGAALTAVGLAFTFDAILSTPWEDTDLMSWRPGLAWGFGITTLLVGAIMWAVGSGRWARHWAAVENELSVAAVEARQP